LHVKPDGTKFYVIDLTNTRVLQFAMSSAWDVSTASYESKLFNLSSQESSPRDITFSEDGTKMYAVGIGSDAVFQYTLSSAWDVSTASYASKSLDVSSEDTAPIGLDISRNGKNLVVGGAAGNDVNQYNLTTAFDVSTGSYSSTISTMNNGYFPALAGETSETTKLYVTSNNVIRQYSVGGSIPTVTSSPFTFTGLTNGTSYTFNVWAINPFGWSSPSDASGSVSPAAALALFMGGENASGTRVNSIDKVNISSTGNATDYGDLSTVVSGASGIGSLTRAVRASGYTGAYVNTIEFKLFSSSGNMSDFGDLVNGYTSFRGAGLGSATRGLISGGLDSGVAVNVIQYITIASEGNATDFGDMTSTEREHGACSSSTRGIMAGGDSNGNVIQYVTIASTGNATDFGDLTTSRGALCGCSSSTRGVFAGGSSSNVIDYITIASTGNATDFGDLAAAVNYPMGASSSTRGLFAGGVEDSRSDRIQYVTIASTGNSTDFGDLTIPREQGAGTSNAHGGLS
jgi:hypothetical protein